jgi:hypothetical protein
VSHAYKTSETLFEAKITSNLSAIADAVGLHKALWCPDEIGVTRAWQLIQILDYGLKKLVSRKGELKQLEPSNGWGSCEQLIEVAQEYLDACTRFPESTIEVSR